MAGNTIKMEGKAPIKVSGTTCRFSSFVVRHMKENPADLFCVNMLQMVCKQKLAI